MSTRMIHRPIYRDFVQAWREGRRWPALLEGYLAPHRALLRNFYRNFVGFGEDVGRGDEMDVVRIHYRRHWAGRPDESDALVARLGQVDPLVAHQWNDGATNDNDSPTLADMVERTATTIERELRPRVAIDIVSLIGLGTTNACQLIHEGTPTVVLALDVWGQTFIDAPLPWADIPLWLSHELAHVIRYAEGETGFADFAVAGDLDYTAAMGTLPLLEFLVDEGLASVTARRFGGATDEAHALGFTDEQWAWCQAHGEELWAEIWPKLQAPLTMDGYARYFSFEADDIPPRTGYWLGMQLVERYLERTEASLAEALRRPAEDFVAGWRVDAES